MKHTGEGTVAVEVYLVTASGKLVHTLSDMKNVFLEFRVIDSGIGVNGDTTLLFDPFYSGDGSTGLGLFVVRRQSNALGGSCGVQDNAYGCDGATFW